MGFQSKNFSKKKKNLKLIKKNLEKRMLNYKK